MTAPSAKREPEHMCEPGRHYESCTRAFGALALAHEAVSAELEKALAPLSLGIGEFDVLIGLDSRPDRASPLGALATVARLSQPAISRMIDRLESRGLIRRLNCPQDRRSVTVQLTSNGQALLEKAIPLHENCIREKLLAHLTVEEREVLRVALLKIAGANGTNENPVLPGGRAG